MEIVLRVKGKLTNIITKTSRENMGSCLVNLSPNEHKNRTGLEMEP